MPIILIGPYMLIVNLIRTMRKRKLMLLNSYGHQMQSYVLVHRLSRFQRIGKNKLVSLLMFLSVIVYLMNCLEAETSSCLMSYRRLRSWSSMHIASGIILFLMQLMIAISFIEKSNRPFFWRETVGEFPTVLQISLNKEQTVQRNRKLTEVHQGGRKEKKTEGLYNCLYP